MAKKRKAPRVFPSTMMARNVRVPRGPESNRDNAAWQHTEAGRNEATKSIAFGLQLPRLKGGAVGIVQMGGTQEIAGYPLIASKSRVEALAVMWQTYRRQGITRFTYVKLEENSRYCLKLFVAEEFWFFIRECYLTQTGQRSYPYNSKVNAMGARDRRNILWDEEFPLVQKT